MPEISIVSNEEEARLAQRTELDAIDRKILALKLLHPRWSNQEIGEEVGLNRIQVWRRLARGPLSAVMTEIQREAIESAKDAVITEALDAVRVLGRLARAECRCPRTYKESPDHEQMCMTPVPYPVQRAAAKDLIDILTSKRNEEKEPEEEVWEASVSEVGSIAVKKKIAEGRVIDVDSLVSRDDDEDH